MTEDGDADFGGEVVCAKRLEDTAGVVGQDQVVDGRVSAKQAAVVGRYVQGRVAGVDEAEQSLEVLPDGLRTERITLVEDLGERVGRQQFAVFGKGDEEDAVENGLGVLDDLGEGLPGVVLRQRDDQGLPPLPVIPIERLGDFLVGTRTVLEQAGGASAQQVVGTEKQLKALVFSIAVGQFEDVPALVNLPGVTDGVEADLQHVGEQHPLAVPGVVGIFPGLLHRAFVAAGHDRVEVEGVGALEFDRRDDLPRTRSEMAERCIGAAGAGLLLLMHGPLRIAIAEGLVAE